MVEAASLSRPARRGIQYLLSEGVQEMEAKVRDFMKLLQVDKRIGAADAQKAYTLLKLQFNWLLDSLDIFADVLSLRSEHHTGTWLAGMDVLAEDTLLLKGSYFKAPPLVTYLDRGHGAAIRRARTRLPGGKSNPVAVIRVPRERMISTGIASSLVHEVGHQGASLLGLIPSMRKVIQERVKMEPESATLWNWFDRWISEILSDFWSVAMIGIGSTTGLMNVVSVPSYFVFRLKPDDPHPPPWIRLRLSIAFGAVLFPDQQWERLRQLWDRLYPIKLAGPEKSRIFQHLDQLVPEFADLLVNHRPPSLKGKMLREVFPVEYRQPKRLRQLYQQWVKNPRDMKRYRPSIVFAAIGQARADQVISPRRENRHLRNMLTYWALKRVL
ncbi:hypothetical protein [Flavilitoribacter nigricans]|nr:hypothetical protein [Flavilitoribacter nigricans]